MNLTNLTDGQIRYIENNCTAVTEESYADFLDEVHPEVRIGELTFSPPPPASLRSVIPSRSALDSPTIAARTT